jgi:hypothetical protein
MDGPATSSSAAIRASVALLGRSFTGWLLPIVLLGWFAALPEALAARHLDDLLGMIAGPNGFDLQMIGGVAYAGLVALFFKLLLDLVALQWAFTVLADVAAGREVSLTGGLRRMASWKLQVSWLVSGVLVSLGTSVWYFGGCLLLLPFGFAVAEAYEQQNGMAAIGASARLGLARGPGGTRYGMPMVLVSTGLLLLAALLSCGVDLGGMVFSSGPDVDTLLAAAGKLDPARPDALVSTLVKVFFPTPSWPETLTTIFVAPARQLVEVALLAIQLVGYHHARSLVPAETLPAEAPPAG